MVWSSISEANIQFSF